MAQVLDLSLIQYFLPILLFLIIWAVLYSLLKNKQYISDKDSINSLIAFIASLLIVIESNSVLFLGTLLPIFLFIAVATIFFLLIFSFIGWESKSLNEEVESNSIITWVVVVIGFLIVAYSAGQIFGQQLLESRNPDGVPSDIKNEYGLNEKNNIINSNNNEIKSTGTGDFFSNLTNTLFNPKVLGMLLILIVGALVIIMLSIPEDD
ncbi:hypothetical protein HOK68_01775 [Candidatus Woesearchaeota archaeon]|jgi:hypothetical protein|nr:hypothetical protein [Candidatus Woesearchaeota archaeon]MBT4387258.1 hypothetical protein [Candidatus Woesearchaeota archaeon]MBT4596259.1 hypothetical protein [Candidatus Woesearchaeota archaeon]MBT5741518.1 hypothetical protein [Candidatus Woesearchaeota archaeon]MBT6505490.1 hypothetical protein [Candidatus Woesearchaeota archaeon]